MKSIFTFALLLLSLTTLAVSSSVSFAAPAAQATIGDAAAPSQDLPFTLKVEYLAGIAAWLPVGTFNLTANSTDDTQLIVNYKGDPFVATFTIRAVFLGMHDGHESWQLSVTRLDSINDQPMSAPVTSELTLDRGGPGIRLVTKGRYSLQARDLRLGFTLN